MSARKKIILISFIIVGAFFLTKMMDPTEIEWKTPQLSAAGSVTIKQLGITPTKMLIQNNYLYAISWDQLYIIPITSAGVLGTPRNYTLFGGINRSSNAHYNDFVSLESICYYNSMLFLGMYGWNTDTGAFSGISRISITNPLSPGPELFNKTIGTPKSCIGNNRTLFAAITGQGLMTMNISDINSPGAPVYKNTTGYVSDIAIKGDFAYLSTDSTGLAMINVSNPSNPSAPQYFNTTVGARHMYLDQNQLYVGTFNGIHIVDVSNQSKPQELTYFAMGSEIHDIEKKDNFVIVAENRPGVGILDVSTPVTPTGNRSKDLKHHAYCIAIQGNFAYLGIEGIGIEILDISSPSTLGMEDNIPADAVKIRDLEISKQFYLTIVEGHIEDNYNLIQAYITLYQVNTNIAKIAVKIFAHGGSDENIWDYTFRVKNLQGVELANYQNIQLDDLWEDDSFVLTVNWETGFIFTLDAIETYKYCTSFDSEWDIQRQLDVITCYNWNTKTYTISESVNYDPVKERNDKIILGVEIGAPILVIVGIFIIKNRKSGKMSVPNSTPKTSNTFTVQQGTFNPQTTKPSTLFDASSPETYKKPKSNDDDSGWN